MTLKDGDARRLMASAQAGDRVAYRAVLGSARDWLMRYFAKRIAASMVEELVQDTLLSIHSKRSSYDPARPFYPWLAAIARYRWIDALRRHTVTHELEEIHAPVSSEEDAVLSRLSLEGLLGHLPQAQADAITLTKIEGLSVREVSAVTGQSEALVKVNVHRGLKKMAALVESE